MTKSKKYKISVITPIRNSEFYLERCLASLLKQNFEYIQYIFIDDASNDNSITVLKEIISRYPSKKEDCIIINQEENKGIAYCRQLGIKVSSGEYIAFCDSDDYIEPEMFLSLYKEAKRTNADIISCSYFIEEKQTKIINKKYGINWIECFKDIYENCEIALWDKLFKRDLLVKNNIYPSEGYNYYEDCYITIKALYYAKKISVINNPIYHYVNCPISSSKQNISENLKSMKYYISELESFFKKEVVSPKLYKNLIDRLKFQYKIKLKQNRLTNRKDWYKIYKESHSQILKFSDIPLLGRLKLYCLINLRLY